MIDWFVLLVPFAVLPVVLILGFVGCFLDVEGIPDAPSFTYPSGLPTMPTGNVVKLVVTMTVTGEDGASGSETATRSALEINNANGETIKFPSIVLEAIDAQEEGSAVCTVILTIGGNPDTTLPALSTTHDNPTADFTLSGTAPGFTLT
jgi:hypothetical protein